MLTGSEAARSSAASAFRAQRAPELRLEVLHAGVHAFDRPQRARVLRDVRPLVLEVVAVAEVLHVHRRLIRLRAVERHALVVILLEAILHVEQRPVREHHVIAVGGVVVGELPVALVLEPVRLAESNAAPGVPVEPFVDRFGRRTQVLGERRRSGIQRPEHEASVALDPRHLRQVELRIPEVARVAVGPGNAAQLAAVEVRPAVVRALKGLRGPSVLPAERGAAVGAAIVERADRAPAVAQHDQRPQAHPDGDEGIVLRDLALVGEIDPGAAEDARHLLLKDGGIGVEQAVHAVLLHQVVQVVGRHLRLAREYLQPFATSAEFGRV